MSIPFHYRMTVAALLAFLLAIAGCSGDDDAAATTSSVVTIEPSTDPVDSDVPSEYLDAVVADVAARSGLATESFMFLDSTAVEWADQRLGCVHLEEPAEPAPIDGYRVVVDTGEAQYDYRLDQAGLFYLCGDPVETSPEHEEEHHEDEDGHHEDGPEEDTS